ncbi:MAG: 16S rRNA (cytidine(1402)-2'-O)-methyltransferase [Pseudomonadota bacterium]
MADKKGTLYVVATPIGNLEDITLRALRVLREVDLIAAEDTRHTQKLLSSHGIPGAGRMTSYYDQNERLKTPQIIARLEQGQEVALVSDAGTPTVSDPGYDLIREAGRRGIRVVAVPGPSAAVAALSVSGLPTDRFLFVGFLPPRPQQRGRALQELASEKATLVFYVAGRNLAKIVAEMLQALGERQVVVAREITKLNEEALRGGFAEVGAALKDRPERARGEAVMIVSGREEEFPPRPVDAGEIAEMLRAAMNEGASLRQAVRVVAVAAGLPRRKVYETALELKSQDSREG